MTLYVSNYASPARGFCHIRKKAYVLYIFSAEVYCRETSLSQAMHIDVHKEMIV
jgi:hypothetical protein